MGSCGFYHSRKAIFTRSQLDDSDESHLMKKKCRFENGWLWWSGGCEGPPVASLTGKLCQELVCWICTGLMASSELLGMLACSQRMTEAPCCKAQVESYSWNCEEKKKLFLSTWLDLFASKHISSVATAKCYFPASHYSLLWHPKSVFLRPKELCYLKGLSTQYHIYWIYCMHQIE